jgi:hypothetical protein
MAKGLIDFDIKTKTPKITFDAPDDPRFWKAIAIEAQKTVRERTEKDGLDVNGKGFKPYTKAYREFRSKQGKSTRPNLSLSSNMLGGMRAIGRKGMAIVRLTGEEGFKAFQNEERGRKFFDLSKEQTEDIFKGVSKWIARTNKLK